MFPLEELKEELKKKAGGLDFEVMDASCAEQALQLGTEIERLGAFIKAGAARRIDQLGTWRGGGHSSAADFMAKRTGTTVGNAIGVLETARRMAELPATEAAFRAGQISEQQAKEIASAAAASPSSEGELLQTAKTHDMTALKDRCAKVRAAALPDEASRNQAIHKKRYFRHWTDRQGTFRFDGSLTPQAGAILLAGLEPLYQRVFAEARKQGRKEPFEAYRADALVTMAEHARGCTSEGKRMFPSAMVNIRVDHEALFRGRVCSGETCEIAGVGPIPVAVVKDFLQDCFLTAVVTDGQDVAAIKRFGRNMPEALRTAVFERDQTCVAPGCHQRRGLEIDHIVQVSDQGPTQLTNLARLCRHHHYLKTHKGFRLSGGPGKWKFDPPAKRSGESGPAAVAAGNARGSESAGTEGRDPPGS